MVVYVESVFAENFALDSMLLYLAFRASKTPFLWRNLFLSATVGGIFALVYPFFNFPPFLSFTIKTCVGFLLCLLCFPPIKNKNRVGRYAFTCFFFFSFSFAFAGALLLFYQNFPRQNETYTIAQAPVALVLCSAVAFCLAVGWGIKKWYQKRAIHRFAYPCEVRRGEKRARAIGFLDSGNSATKNGVPVCFISPDIAYDLWGNELLLLQGYREEITVLTVSGEKTLPLLRGELQIQTPKGVFRAREVYFSPSAHIVSREYQILLQSNILEEQAL